MCESVADNITKKPYAIPKYTIENGITFLLVESRTTNEKFNKIPLEIFGNHNLMNISGARLVCNELDVSDEQFYMAISSFKGASNRLELIGNNEKTSIYKDFAHSPSKVKATLPALIT